MEVGENICERREILLKVMLYGDGNRYLNLSARRAGHVKIWLSESGCSELQCVHVGGRGRG